MPAQQVLVVDENQSFCTQVVAAFSEVGIEARGCSRGSEALLLAASLSPDLIIVDLVRPGSEGRWLLGRLYAQGDETPLSTAPRLVLALAPVAGDFSGLPDGIEVMVKPIFPGQVVSSATRLLGSLDGHALPLSGAASRPPVPATPPSAPVFAVPPSGLSPTSAATPYPAAEARPAHVGKPAVEHVLPPGPAPIDPFDDDSDFGPADTLLAPAASISALARSMVHVPDPHAEKAPAASEGAATTLLHNGGEATVPLIEFDLRGELAHRLDLRLPPSGSPAEARRTEPPSSGWPLGPIESEREALTGSLAAIPLLDLLSLLARQCQTGILRVSYAPALTSASSSLARRFTLILRHGQLEQVVAVGLPNLRLGRFILELETLRQPELDAVAAARGKRSRAASEDTDSDSNTGVPMVTEYLLGSRLCAAGLLSADELQKALRRQSTELLYEALRLSRGRFAFERTRELPDWASEPAYGAALGLDLEALLLVGARRADDWYQLDLDTAENAVYVSTVAAEQDLRKLGLSGAECAVLLLCSGRHSVAEIAKESRLSLLDVSRTLGRLVSLRLCRRRLPVVLAS